MIHLGQHTDNLRVLSGSFEAGVEQAVKFGMEHVECGVVYGIYYVGYMGYEPSLHMWGNPLEIRNYVESRGLRMSQIDAAFPMMDFEGSKHGVFYVQQAIRFASHLGCPKVDTTDSGKMDLTVPRDEIFATTVRNYREVLKWAESFKVIVNVEPHGPLTNDVDFMYKLMTYFESEYLRVNMDTGNTFIAGNDPFEYLKALRKYVTHCHIKDVSASLAAALRGEETGIACSEEAIGKGVNASNIEKCLKFLNDTNWDGDASVECAGTDANIKSSMEWLKTII